jgi:hypothetical protein
MDEIFGTADLSGIEDVGTAAQKQIERAAEVEHVTQTKA